MQAMIKSIGSFMQIWNVVNDETAVSEWRVIKISVPGEIGVKMIEQIKEDCDSMVKKGKWTKREADIHFKTMKHKIIERVFEIEKEMEEYEKEQKWRKDIFRY